MSEMIKERPILMCDEMVIQTLADLKTHTRRVIKPQPPKRFETVTFDEHGAFWNDDGAFESFPNMVMGRVKCPYGQPGDRLWVRETFLNNALDGYDPVYFYRADDRDKPEDRNWKPSIFMPRWASRITLEIVSVRVERVSSITVEDCYAEGIYKPRKDAAFPNSHAAVAKAEYMHLWNSINAKRGFGWDKKPWVWVIEFRRLTP